jgi:hypothetical protein
VGVREASAQLLTGHCPEEPHAWVVRDHQLELVAHRGPKRRGRRVAPDEGQRPVLSPDAACGSDQVLHALAALEPPDVQESRFLTVPRRIARTRPRHNRVWDADWIRDAVGAIEPSVGVEDITARPEKVVRMAQGVALELEGQARVAILGRESVQDRAHLGRRVCADGERRMAEAWIECVDCLRHYAPFAQVVGELDQLWAAVGVEARDRVENACAPEVQDSVPAAHLGSLGLGHELESNVRRDPRIGGGNELAVAPLMQSRRDDRHLRMRCQGRRGERHVVPQSCGVEWIDLAGHEDNARLAHYGAKLAVRRCRGRR